VVVGVYAGGVYAVVVVVGVVFGGVYAGGVYDPYAGVISTSLMAPRMGIDWTIAKAITAMIKARIIEQKRG